MALRLWMTEKWWLWRNGRIVYGDPLYAGRHPFQVLLLSLCVVTGTTQLIIGVEPGSIRAGLPEVLAVMWSTTLIIGPTLGLIGAFFGRVHLDTGLTLERVGLSFTSVVALIYAVNIAIFAGAPGIVAAGITLGFGFAALIRVRDIGKIFHLALMKNPTEGDG